MTAGRCGHVFDLLVRRMGPLAMMPSAKLVRWSERDALGDLHPRRRLQERDFVVLQQPAFPPRTTDLGGLYGYIYHYIDRGRALRLRTSTDPGTFFV